MIEELFSSKARVEILKLFLFNPEDKFYQRQISLRTRQPIRAVQREVERFERIGLVKKSAEGNRLYYQVYRKNPIFEELKLILLKTEGIAEALGRRLEARKDIEFAFVYGSYAMGRESSLSDIDVMVIGSVSSKELSRVLSRPKAELAREINYAVFKAREFAAKVKGGDHFLNTILKEKKIFIIGSENELERLVKSG